MGQTKIKKKSPSIFPARLSLTSPMPGIPIAEGESLEIASQQEHALFLQCAEIYRVTDLMLRNLSIMIDAYSKYRTRDPFREALVLRFSGVDETVLSQIDPTIEIPVLAAFNRLHELRLKLGHVDTLPFTVKSEIETQLSLLAKTWDEIRALVLKKLGWKLQSLEIS